MTHYYHMHTSKGDVCLGVWGYRGMYVTIALLVVGNRERKTKERTHYVTTSVRP